VIRAALLAAAAVAFVALVTSKSVRSQRIAVLNGLKYEIMRYSNDTIEVIREDGLRFTLDIKTRASTLQVGTREQMENALQNMWRACLAQVPLAETRVS
jgi:hypothetical protein